MKKRICIVVSNPITITAFLLEPLKKLNENYDIHIIVNGNLVNTLDHLNDIKIIHVSINREISLIEDFRALLILIKLFKHYNFYSVHSITPKAGLLAMIAAFISGIPLRIHTFTGQVWATQSGLNRWFLKQLDRLIGKLATNILVDSSSQRQFLLDEQVIQSSYSKVLANGSISGVALDRFKPNKLIRSSIRKQFSIGEDETLFLFIGRLNHDKGLLDLSKAFADNLYHKAQLMIVGPDEADIKFQMKYILRACLAKVHFIGFSDKPESFMAAADILCLPSYREGFGSVIIEAAATGIPTIGSRIYGIEDAVIDGQTGLLFEPGDIKELGHHMSTVMSDKALTKTLAENARRRAQEQFSSEALSSAWLQYYRENS